MRQYLLYQGHGHRFYHSQGLNSQNKIYIFESDYLNDQVSNFKVNNCQKKIAYTNIEEFFLVQ